MNNELYHYGVKGMKWGVHRFIDEDGNPTELGKYHYGYYDKKMFGKGVRNKPTMIGKSLMKSDAKRLRKDPNKEVRQNGERVFLDTFDKLKDLKISDIDAATIARGRELEFKRAYLVAGSIGGLAINLASNRDFDKDKKVMKNKKIDWDVRII